MVSGHVNGTTAISSQLRLPCREFDPAWLLTLPAQTAFAKGDDAAETDLSAYGGRAGHSDPSRLVFIGEAGQDQHDT